ncbi:MAG: radical SAM protein [Candidatus Omnitrophota bacterium]
MSRFSVRNRVLHEIDAEVDQAPDGIFCFIDYSCDNDCIHCLVGDKHIRRALDLDALKEMLNEGLPHQRLVELGGGEPTLSKKLLPILEYLKEKGAVTRLLTNARRLKDKSLCGTLLAKVDQCVVALHSHRPEIHEAITRRKGSFAETVRGIQNIKAMGKHLQLMLIIHRWNYREIIDLVQFAEGFRPDLITFESLVYTGHNALKSPLAIRLGKLAPQIEKALEELNDRVKVEIMSYPLCLFRGRYWKYFRCTRRKAALTNLLFKKKWATFASNIELSPKCAPCQIRDHCPGTWNTYLALYGDRELKPFKKRGASRKRLIVSSVCPAKAVLGARC